MKKPRLVQAACRRVAQAVRTAFGTCLVLTGPACFAQTEDPDLPGLRFSGFGTVGVVHADAPEGWSYRREISQVGSRRSTRADVDSRLGLQLNYAATPQVELVGQVMATRRSPYADRLDSIEWAFAAFRPSADWTLRVGRVNLDQFLMSDYRNVGFAYPYARPPVDYYGSIPSRLDGADLARSWDLEGALWRVKGFVGRTRFGDLNFDSNTLVKSSYGLMVSREADGLLVRAGLSHINIGDLPNTAKSLYDALSTLTALPVPSVAADAKLLRQRIDYGHSGATYVALAATYDWHQWQLTAEAARVMGQPIFAFDAAYVSVARRFGPITGFGSLSGLRGTSSRLVTPEWAATLAPLLGPAAAQQAQFLGSTATDVINRSLPDQRTLSLGARWDLHPQLALKLQWDRVFVGEYGGRLWANPTDSSMRSNVTSVTLDFIF